MAKIVQMSVGRTFNMGNYESLRLELTVEVDENEDVIAVATQQEERLQALKQGLSKKYKEACRLALYGFREAKKLGYTKAQYDEHMAYLEEVQELFNE